MKTKDYISFAILAVYFFIIVRLDAMLFKFLGNELWTTAFYIKFILYSTFAYCVYKFLKIKKPVSILNEEEKMDISKTILYSVVIGVVILVFENALEHILKALGCFIEDNTQMYKQSYLMFKPRILQSNIVYPIVYGFIFVNLLSGYLFDLFKGAKINMKLVFVPILVTLFSMVVFKDYSVQTVVTDFFITFLIFALFYKTKRLESTMISAVTWSLLSVVVLFMK